ncbi:MAG: septum formation initiator family protein, partial [Atopobium minutum]|nr:septum formation initiator family protein [Atopobium minutum]
MASADDTISFKAQKGGKTTRAARSSKTGSTAQRSGAGRTSQPTKTAKSLQNKTVQNKAPQDRMTQERAKVSSDGGRIHAEKRAVRRQEKPSTKLQQLAVWRSKLGNHRGVLVVLGAILLVIISLYAPVRAWYSAHRDAELYTKQLQKLQEDNAALQDNVTRLQSKEGIEDEARKRGY